MLDSVQTLRLRHILRVQNERIQNSKNHGVCADRQCQRHNRSDRESGRLAQHAKAETHILYQRLDEIVAERVVAFLLVFHLAAELDARAAFCLGAI